VAPAGYGKTTLLSEWAEQEERAFAWLSLDRRHDDAALLLASVVEALDQLEPVDPAVMESLAAPLPDVGGVAIPRLQAALQARSESFVLVLDDVHCLTTDSALEVLEGLLDCLPAGSKLALASRTEPQLPLGRLRAHRRLVEVNQADMAMSPDEAAELIGLVGLDLSPAQLDALVQRTEGWPAALYLAALALDEQADLDAAIAGFAGDDRFVVDYLRDVFMEGVAEEQQRFLLRTAVLDRLCGDLCDAVLEFQGSGTTLRDLSRSNLLLTRLDHHDEWYRYHGLLRETLLAELRRSEPAAEPGLHRRASAWYTEHEDFDRAIDHAIVAGDTAVAGDLIWSSFPSYASRGRVATIDRWLERFDEATISSHPGLALAAVQASLTRGDGEAAHRWGKVAQRAAKARSEAPARDVEAGLLLATATIGAEGVAQVEIDAGRAYDLMQETDIWRTVCCLLVGTAIKLSGGDAIAADRWLEEGTRRAAVAPNIQALCQAQRALFSREQDLGLAADLVVHARTRVDRYGLGDYPTMALVFAVLALFRARQGDVAGAHEDTRVAKRLLGRVKDFIPWYEAETRIVLARALHRLDDRPGARELLSEATRHLRQTPDAALLDQWLRNASAALDDGAIEAGLTRAELRVLQFLPTHFSFREIAERLYVSPNTIKTQAQSIYRKLDVSTRGEAVDHARAAGLIGESPRSGDSRSPNDG
jgi:LuxR family maltose regulon positive regulatory protein